MHTFANREFATKLLYGILVHSCVCVSESVSTVTITIERCECVELYVNRFSFAHVLRCYLSLFCAERKLFFSCAIAHEGDSCRLFP